MGRDSPPRTRRSDFSQHFFRFSENRSNQPSRRKSLRFSTNNNSSQRHMRLTRSSLKSLEIPSESPLTDIAEITLYFLFSKLLFFISKNIPSNDRSDYSKNLDPSNERLKYSRNKNDSFDQLSDQSDGFSHYIF
jgi:hypothetical protein